MIEFIPPILFHLIITIGFAFIVGLEFHSYLRVNQYQYGFGSTRTFVLISLLGFVLFQLNNDGLFFAMGMGILGALLLIYYWYQSAEKHYSLLEIILTLLVFSLGPIAIHFPSWFLILIVVVLILLLGEKPRIKKFSESLNNNEIVTLAKFLILSGVILPLLPDKQLASSLPITYYKVWLAVIVVSGFSYFSYLAQIYFFKTRGLLLTGVLGGLYSSTAISVVISRRAQLMKNDRSQVSSALILATAMMYLRLLGIIFFMDGVAGKELLTPFAIAILLSCLVAISLNFWDQRTPTIPTSDTNQHPLELTTAILFAFMFIFFAFITQYVIQNYGDKGLDFLSIVVGFTDIDPFILSLLSGKFGVTENAIVSAVIVASGSNNLLKATYIVAVARNRSVMVAATWLIFLFILSLGYVFI
ncbi:MAG: DUF4010 domain-containing protein [Methylococcales bacterium]